ncbi:hypothetical protein H7I57_24170, partial [Mycobacterium pyrenivorans]|nr:hypothetical protein [Mycolicibacterium pyrenivorans]
MIVGAAGWAGIEVGRRYLGDGLNRTTGNVRTLAIGGGLVVLANAHQWLNITLAIGGGLVVLGVLVTLLGNLGRRVVRKPKPAGAPTA